MTPNDTKENLLATLNFKSPAYIPYGLESVRTYWHRDAKFFFGNGDPFATAWTDIWGTDWVLGDKDAPESFHPVTFPLTSLDDIESFTFPDPYDPSLFGGLDIDKLDRNNNLLMMSNPGCLFTRAWLLRGMENFLSDMLLEPELAELLLDKVLAYQEAIVARQLAYKPDIVYFGDDAGTTKALMMSPVLWRKMIKPRLAKLVQACRAAGCYVILHCCGKITDIVDDFIEIGINVLNPVQVSTNDLVLLKQKSQGRLVLFGGIDTDLLVKGTPGEVKNHTRKMLDVLAPGGGYIANPDQLLPFPQENIDAAREVVREFCYMYCSESI